jgi:hypothetical protein
MTIENKIFTESKRLKEIVESHNWTLYDVTRPKGYNDIKYEWDELEKENPAQEYQIEHNYLFVPIPKKGETLKKAHSQVLEGIAASLVIHNPDEDRWLSLTVKKKPIDELTGNSATALFTRLFFVDECAYVTTPGDSPELDFVAIKYDCLIDTFEKYFSIFPPKLVVEIYTEQE